MRFPEPHPGLVIRYAYRWKREPDAGREEGSKNRPCAIVLSVVDDDGALEVMGLPITHGAPKRARLDRNLPGNQAASGRRFRATVGRDRRSERLRVVRAKPSSSTWVR